MGAQLSQALNQIVITTSSIAYPEQDDAIKQQAQRQRETGFNIYNNYGTKKVDIDFTSFGPKKYYTDSAEAQVFQHLKKIQKKQSILRKYKYWQDFDRIDCIAQKSAPTFHHLAQKMCMFHLLISFFMGRWCALGYNNCYISTAVSMKTITKTLIVFSPISIFFLLRSPVSHPINQEYFKTLPHQIRMYEIADYEINAYKYVKDIKYNYKYPSQMTYQQVRWNYNNKALQQPYVDAVNYYKRKYNIISVPNFEVKQARPQSA